MLWAPRGSNPQPMDYGYPAGFPAGVDRDPHYCLTRMTNARTEAANLHAKNIKRAGRGYVNHHNYRARILLAATVKNAE